jgi:hypothetical protein
MAGIMDILQLLLGWLGPGTEQTFVELLVFTFAILVYGVVIFNFYRFVAARDVFGFDIDQYRREHAGAINKFFNSILGVIKYGLIFPVVVFIAFAAFSLMLFIVGKTIPSNQVLVISIVIVAAVRVSSYYNEDLSRDVAKMLPFTILGIAIADPTFLSLEIVSSRLAGIAGFLPLLIRYVIFVILIEWVLRILLLFKHIFFGVAEGESGGREVVVVKEVRKVIKRPARKKR